MKGTNREELKKVKNVIQYAVFAAYHLSLQTSFLVDEGATLPKMVQGQSIAVQEKATAAPAISVSTDLIASTNSEAVPESSAHHPENVGLNPELGRCEPFSGHFSLGHGFPTSTDPVEGVVGNVLSDACNNDLASNITLYSSLDQSHERKDPNALSDIGSLSQPESLVIFSQDEKQHEEVYELTRSERVDENEASSEYFSAADAHQSILVSFSSHCVLKGTVCERSQLMRIKFYGCFDKPLGKYLRDDLFDQVIFYGFPLPIFVILGCKVKLTINFFPPFARHHAVDHVKNQLKPMSYAIPISKEILQSMSGVFQL